MSDGLKLFDEQALSANTAALQKIIDLLDQRLPSGLKKTNDEGTKAKQWTEEWSKSLKSSADTLNEVSDAAGKVVAAAEKIGDLAAENERNAQAAKTFGSELQGVRDAVHGAMPDSEILSAWEKLRTSGLNLTVKELEDIEAVSRKTAKALGTDTKAELDKTIEALASGAPDAFKKLGVRIKDGASRAEVFEAAMKKWRGEAKNSGKEADTVKEKLAQFKVGINDVATALAAAVVKIISLIGKIPVLGEAMSRFSKDIRQIGNEIDQLGGNDAAGKAARDAGRSGDSAGSFAGFSGAYAAQVAGDNARADTRMQIAQMQQILRRAGVDLSGISSTEKLDSATLGSLHTRLARIVRAGGLGALTGSGGDLAAIRAAGEAQRDAILAEFTKGVATKAAEDKKSDALLAAALRTQGLPGTVQEAAREAARKKDKPRDEIGAGVHAATGPTREELERKLADIQRKQVLESLTRALAAASASGSGAVVAQGELGLVNQIDLYKQRLEQIAARERAEADAINLKLATRTLTLKQRVDLEERLAEIGGEERAAQAALAQVEERQRLLKQADFQLTQQTFATDLQLYQQAIASKEAGLRLTESEQAALSQRADMLARMHELEGGLKGALADAQAEAAAAQTQEAKNAALTKELQLRVQLADVQSKTRAEEIAQNERALRGNLGEQLSKKFLGQLGQTKTGAQQFADVAQQTFQQVSDGLAQNIVAIAEGSKTADQAFRDILKSFLSTMTQRAVVEVLANSAMAAAAAFTPGRQAEAAGYATAAAIWGAVGVVAGSSLAGVSAASRPAASAGGGSASAGRSVPPPSSGSQPRESGGFALTVNVEGVGITDAGVKTNVGRAVESALAGGYIPRYRIQRAVS